MPEPFGPSGVAHRASAAAARGVTRRVGVSRSADTSRAGYDLIELTTTGLNNLIDPQAQRLVKIPRQAGLQHENIMADPAYRAIIVGNLPG